jgi:hypothetical protein
MNTQSAGGGDTRVGTPVSTRTSAGLVLSNVRPALLTTLGAFGTYMGTLTNQNYELLQESLTTTNIVQKKLIEVVNNQEQSIQRIHDTIERYTNLFHYLVILNPANLETAHWSAVNRVKAEIDQIQNVLHIAQWRRLALDFLSTIQLHNLFTTLKRAAQSTLSDLLISKPSDLLQLELSYFYEGTIVTLLLHVPMVPAGS